MEIKAELTNYKEAVKALDALPDKFQKQVLLKMLRNGGNAIAKEARSNLLSHGQRFAALAKSIGNITAKSKNAIIYIGPRVKGKWKYIGYIAHWVEYGNYGSKKGGNYKPFPFMRPAIDTKKETVRKNITANFKTKLQKSIDKTLTKLK